MINISKRCILATKYPNKLITIMKLNMLFVFLGTVQIFATSYSQNARVNLNVENGTIVDIFNEIEKQSEYKIFYRMDDIDLEKKYTVNYTDQLVSELLPEVLGEENNTYQLVDKIIVITSNEMKQQVSVTGTLTDASTGEPLPGVYVIPEGTNTGAVTDAQGKYTLQVTNSNVNLVFSYVGYTTQSVAIAGRSVVDIQLVPEVQSLEEVVVIGYGTQKKIDLTGSVSVVSSKDFEKTPVTDALDAMQGKVAGVTIVSNSGEPGAEKEIRIRGVQSWGASTTPLYVIDGVILDNMNSLSPNDIESISILKDAASSAIYGARAANGVVLITTKRGSRSAAPIITFEAYGGAQQYSDLQPERLNSTQWLELDEESYANVGPEALDQSPYGTQNPVDMNLFMVNGKLVNTDWLDVVSQPGRIQNYDLSLRGGNDRSTYYTSATYFKQDGLIMNTGADRISLRFNSDNKVNNFIEFGNSVNIYSHSRFGGVGNPYLGAIRKNPLSRPYETDADGNIINYDFVRSYTMEGGDVGPLIYAKEYKDETRTYGFVGNVFLKVKILKGLTFTPRLSIDYSNSHQSSFTPELHIVGVETQSINSVYKNKDYNFHWIADYMLNYERSFNDVHNVSALFVYSQEENKYEYLNGTRYGTPNNQILYLNAGQLENQSVYNGFQDWSFVSYIGRLGYNFKEKYFIQASVRRDGTSRFVGDNRWGVFPSVSAGWRISEEKFFEPWRNIVSDFKIRGSIGTLGNSNVGLYPTYATLDMHTGVMGPMNNQIAIPAYALGAAVYSDVKWEQTQKTNLGFDASLLRSKITVSFDYYQSRTTNLLYGKPIPISAGKYYDVGWDPSDPTINGGEIKNHGVELTLGYQDRKGDFVYGVNGNLSADRNEVVDLEGRQIREQGLEVGQPIYRFFGYTSNGIVQSQADLDANPYLTNPQNDFPIGLGDIWTVDINGRDAEGELTGKPDGKISADDRGFIGRKYPDFIYGLNGYVTYKRWTLQVVGYGVQGVDLNTMVDINGYFQYTSNDVTRVLDRWHATKNPDGNMPKVSKGDMAGNATHTASFWLADASFFKISNINLRYALPMNICQKLRMQNLEVYGSVENLHTFTSYPVGEVDVTDQGMWQQPVTKIPQPRTWVLGLKVSF